MATKPSKTCTRCNAEKPLDDFPTNRSKRDGRQSYCRTCGNARTRAYNASPRGKEAQQARMARWLENGGREKRADLERKRRGSSARRRVAFETHLRAYGLTRAAFDALVVAQSGRCAVCIEPMDAGGRTGASMHVDHCHRTGAVRGLLCSRCNVALGMAKESAATLRALAAYLDSTNKLLRAV